MERTQTKISFLSSSAELRNRVYEFAVLPAENGDGGVKGSRAIYIGLERKGQKGHVPVMANTSPLGLHNQPLPEPPVNFAKKAYPSTMARTSSLSRLLESVSNLRSIIRRFRSVSGRHSLPESYRGSTQWVRRTAALYKLLLSVRLRERPVMCLSVTSWLTP